jgi:FkbM family methyltransferase
MNHSVEEVFAAIYQRNAWGGEESVSGKGSDTVQTAAIQAEIPALCQALSIRSMLDIPCGDFNWLKDVALGPIAYTGADIVAGLIDHNRQQHEAANIHFRKLDLISDELPRADLVLCRDGLVHLSFEHIFLALQNVCRSGAEYLLTTTFPSRRTNRDIQTGQWRTLNFEVAPFWFPAPLTLIDEQCSQENGAFRDKALGLWKVEVIREALSRHAEVARQNNRNLATAVKALHSRRQGVFFAQIGAMDGVTRDPLCDFVRDFQWKGILVEPLPDLFRQLHRNYEGTPGLLFENCAIAGHCGTLDLYRVPCELTQSGEVPHWASGISSAFRDRNALGGLKLTAAEYALIKDRVVRVPVPCMTLPALLAKHAAERVDVLQISTEGSDLIVLSQLDFNRYRPSIIHVEYYNLPRAEQKDLFYLLVRQGYTLSADHKDVLATRLDL